MESETHIELELKRSGYFMRRKIASDGASLKHSPRCFDKTEKIEKNKARSERDKEN